MKDANRKLWNANQAELREKLPDGIDFEAMKVLLLTHHAMVHSAEMAESGICSFEDELCQGLDDSAMRQIPQKEEHSIVWILWHIARIEDLTMNVLVAESEQVFYAGNWQERLNAPIVHTGNEIPDSEMSALNHDINTVELLAYRRAVGQGTQEIIRQLEADRMKQKAGAELIQRIRDSVDVLPTAEGVIDYWSKRTISGLLLMPPTRHNFLHLNEAMRIKERVLR